MSGRRALLLFLVVLFACAGMWAWIVGPAHTPGARDAGERPRDEAHERVRADAPETPSRVRRPAVPTPRGAHDAEADVARRHVRLLVETAVDEEPVAGARVTLLRWRPAWTTVTADGAGPSLVAEAVSGTDGLVEFTAVPESCWLVRVDAAGFASVHELLLDGFDVGTGGQPISLWPAIPRALLIVDTDDDPVPTAVANIHSQSDLPPLATVSADESGVVRFEAGDGAQIRVSAPGYATMWIEDVVEWGDAAVVLRRGMAVEGIVVTGGGTPVAGAVVEGPYGREPVRTGEDGRFRFDGLLPTAVADTIWARTEEDLTDDAWVRPGSRDVRLVLSESCRVSGHVVHSDGTPVAGVRLGATGQPFGADVTDDEGRFEITGLPPGTVVIEARTLDATLPGEHLDTRGAAGGVKLDLAPGAGADGVEIRLDPVPASCVFFRVETSDGKRFRGYGMSYDDVHDRGYSGHHGTLAGGEWWRLSVPAGTPVELSFTTARDDDIADHFEATMVTRARPEGEPDVVRAPQASDGMVELTLTTVRTDGVAIPDGADVNWLIANRNPERMTRLPPGAPATGIVHVPRGEGLTVLAWADGCGTLELEIPLTDAPRQRFECRLPPEAIVHGHLVTRTGRPVTRAHVEVLVTRPDGTESLSVASFDQLLPDGEFVADQLAGGRGRITVRDTDWRIVAEQTFDVGSGGHAELGEVVVGALPVARGTVIIDGRPASGVGVTAGDGERFASTSTGSDGTFELPVPRRRGATLIVEADDSRALYALDDVIDASPVRLRADATGELSVELDERKRDVDSVDVRLPGGPRVRAARALLLDRFLSLGGLPAGPVEISVSTTPSAGAVRVWRGSVDVVAGTTTHVRLTLER